MSSSAEVRDSVVALATPRLAELRDEAVDRFLGDMKDLIDGSKSERLKAALDTAADMKFKVLTAPTQEMARAYAEGYETALRRIKTLALAEKIVAEQALADMLSAGFKAAMDTFGAVAKGVLEIMVSGIVKGAIAGFTGGGGSDGSSVFPFA